MDTLLPMWLLYKFIDSDVWSGILFVRMPDLHKSLFETTNFINT